MIEQFQFNRTLPVPDQIIHIYHPWMIGGEMANCSTNASTFNVVALRMYAVPLLVPYTLSIKRAIWYNSTIVAGNVDIAIFTEGGSLVASIGSTALSGNSSYQTAALSTSLTRGSYIAAYVCSSATQTIGVNVGSGDLTGSRIRAAGALSQTISALPIATNANPPTWTTLPGLSMPFFGFQTSLSVTAA
jgi:hypothetical protein